MGRANGFRSRLPDYAELTTDLSIVTTMYRSSPHLGEFHRRMKAAAEASCKGEWEMIFVNDGSPDDSLKTALALMESDPRVRIVDLSRNFGHHKAMMAGLEHARGKRIFLIDCDLEEDPALLAGFSKVLDDTGADVAFGVQKSRKGGLFEKASGFAYYSFLRLLADVSLPRNVCTVRLMTRRYVDALLLHKEREVNIAGLWQITGFDQRAVPIEKLRGKGTTYNIVRKASVFVKSVVSFSDRPLVGIFLLGMTVTAASLGYIVFLLVRRLCFGIHVDGWTTIVVSIWLLGGLILFSLGVIGIYLSKVFIESKQRPNAIVRQLYGRDGGRG